MERLFSTRQAARATGLTFRQLDYWARTELIFPERGATGSGSRRGWSFCDLVALGTISEMSAARLMLNVARAHTGIILEAATRAGGAALTVLIFDGNGSAKMLTSIEALFDMLTDGPLSLIVVNVSAIRENLLVHTCTPAI